MTRPPDRTAKKRKRRFHHRRKLGQRVLKPIALNSDAIDWFAFKYAIVRAAIDNDDDLASAFEEVINEMPDQ